MLSNKSTKRTGVTMDNALGTAEPGDYVMSTEGLNDGPKSNTTTLACDAARVRG